VKATAKEWDDVWSAKGLVNKLISFGRNRLTIDFYKHIFKKYINKKTKLLEVGCGTSTTSLHLCPKINSFVGADISDKALELSKEKAKTLGIKNAKFVKGDCFKLPFKESLFDVVWSQGLIEHFSNPQKIIDEKTRVCKVGGYIITSVPGTWTYHQIWYVLTRPKPLRRFWPWTEQIFYSKKLLDSLIPKDTEKIETKRMIKWGVVVQILKKTK
jgi:ubiquinone/menaquinone biosynthesis C-methylase UbiE